MGFGKFLGAFAGIAGFIPGGQGLAAAAAAGAKLAPDDPELRYLAPEAIGGTLLPFGWRAVPAALTMLPCQWLDPFSNGRRLYPLARAQAQNASAKPSRVIDRKCKAFGTRLPARLTAIPLHAWSAADRAAHGGAAGDHPQYVHRYGDSSVYVDKEAILFRMADIEAGFALERAGLDPAWAYYPYSPLSLDRREKPTQVFFVKAGQLRRIGSPQPLFAHPDFRPNSANQPDPDAVTLTGRSILDAAEDYELAVPIIEKAWSQALLQYQDAIALNTELQSQVEEIIAAVRAGEITTAEVQAILENSRPQVPTINTPNAVNVSSSAVAPGSVSSNAPLFVLAAAALILIAARDA